MASFFPSMSRTARKPLSNRRRNRRKCLFEPLENRNLLAVLFADSFENGSPNWAGNWVEDAQDVELRIIKSSAEERDRVVAARTPA